MEILSKYPFSEKTGYGGWRAAQTPTRSKSDLRGAQFGSPKSRVSPQAWHAARESSPSHLITYGRECWREDSDGVGRSALNSALLVSCIYDFGKRAKHAIEVKTEIKQELAQLLCVFWGHFISNVGVEYHVEEMSI